MTAIEAYGIKPEFQEASGLTLWPNFSYLKEPRWRVPHYLKIAESDRNELEGWIWDCILELPEEIRDKIASVKIVGSSAAGTSQLSSDIDFAIWLKSELTHEYYRQIMFDARGRDEFAPFQQRINEASCKLGIRIEGAISGFYTSPIIPTYDIETRVLNGLSDENDWLKFQRPDGRVVAGRTAFDQVTKQYYIVERKQRVCNLPDPYGN